jgi:hypothetical protein
MSDMQDINCHGSVDDWHDRVPDADDLTARSFSCNSSRFEATRAEDARRKSRMRRKDKQANG